MAVKFVKKDQIKVPQEELGDIAKEVSKLGSTGIKKVLKQATVTTSASGEKQEDEDMALSHQAILVSVPEKSVNVGASLGTTVNTGNYNNVKMQVSLNIPCELGLQDEAYEIVKGFVAEKLEDMHTSFVEEGE